jgi:hypothetical protein
MNAIISSQDTHTKHLKLVEDLVLVFILLYTSQFFNQWWHFKLLLITTLMVAHFTKFRFKFPIVFWGLTVLLTSLDFIEHYFYIANHGFVLFYLSFLVFLTHFYPLERVKILRINSLSILILIMFFGAIQKISSPDFMSGNFIAFTALKGDLFKPFQWAHLAPDVFNHNLELINEKLKDIPSSDDHLKLQTPFLGFETFSYYFSIIVMLFEFLMIPVLLIKSVHLKNSILLFFLTGLLFTRLETGFISLLVILSIAQLPSAEKTFKFLYLGLFAVCLGLILVRVGYY